MDAHLDIDALSVMLLSLEGLPVLRKSDLRTPFRLFFRILLFIAEDAPQLAPLQLRLRLLLERQFEEGVLDVRQALRTMQKVESTVLLSADGGRDSEGWMEPSITKQSISAPRKRQRVA